MALSSAMYAAVTGLSALGTGMQTISNNMANASTVGFKAGRTNYEDLISQNTFSGGRANQRGTGVKVSNIQSMFTQGAFKSSAQDTDMAIAGEGFFSVRSQVTGGIKYTRAGVFTQDKDGALVDPSGNILQGWEMSVPKPGEDAKRIGAPTDIKITVVNSPPLSTSQIKVVTNLNADEKNAYDYEEYQLAEDYADAQAKPKAEAAREAEIKRTWDPAQYSLPAIDFSALFDGYLTDPANENHKINFSNSSNSPVFNQKFMELFNNQEHGGIEKPKDPIVFDNKTIRDDLQVLANIGTVMTVELREKGYMTQDEFETLSLGAAEYMVENGYGEHFPVSLGDDLGKVHDIKQSKNQGYNEAFIEVFNEEFSPITFTGKDLTDFTVWKAPKEDDDITDTERASGNMTEAEFAELLLEANEKMVDKANDAGEAAADAVWDSSREDPVNATGQPVPVPNDFSEFATPAAGTAGPNADKFADEFLLLFNTAIDRPRPKPHISDIDKIKVLEEDYGGTITEEQRNAGFMTFKEFNSLNNQTEDKMVADARDAGNAASNNVWHPDATKDPDTMASKTPGDAVPGSAVSHKAITAATGNGSAAVDKAFLRLVNGQNFPPLAIENIADVKIIEDPDLINNELTALGYITQAQFNTWAPAAKANAEAIWGDGLAPAGQPTFTDTTIDPLDGNPIYKSGVVTDDTTDNDEGVNAAFVIRFNAQVPPPTTPITAVTNVKIIDDPGDITDPLRELGYMTEKDFNKMAADAKADVAAIAGAGTLDPAGATEPEDAGGFITGTDTLPKFNGVTESSKTGDDVPKGNPTVVPPVLGGIDYNKQMVIELNKLLGFTFTDTTPPLSQVKIIETDALINTGLISLGYITNAQFEKAVFDTNAAMADRAESEGEIASNQVWDKDGDPKDVVLALGPEQPVNDDYIEVVASDNTEYNKKFLEFFNDGMNGIEPDLRKESVTQLKVIQPEVTPALAITQAQRDAGYMTRAEFNLLVSDTTSFMQNEAKEAREKASKETWDRYTLATVGTPVPAGTKVTPSDSDVFNNRLVAEYNDDYPPAVTIPPIPPTPLQRFADLKVVPDVPGPDRTNGEMTQAEFDTMVTSIDTEMRADNFFKDNPADLVDPERDSGRVEIVESHNSRLFDKTFIATFNKHYGVEFDGTDLSKFTVWEDTTRVFNDDERAAGNMTKTQYDAMIVQTIGAVENIAIANGETEYVTIYKQDFDPAYSIIEAQLPQWQLEGNGFAAAWDGSSKSPIEDDAYNHQESVVIFDALGNEHTITTYYQKNPHMENVWDYIITTDPKTDARKDMDLTALFDNPASFAGLIQKGKVTFTADGDDRYGGAVKDIESQNLDLSNSKKAFVDEPQTEDASSKLQYATIGGYYTGSPTINPRTGNYESTPRTYDIRWGSEDTHEQWQKDFQLWAGDKNPPVTDFGSATVIAEFVAFTGRDQLELDESKWYDHVPGSPPTSGFTVTDSTGHVEYIRIEDDQYAGPYPFGSGLSLEFDEDMKPFNNFDEPGVDNMKLSVESEQIAWTNNKPNEEGLYDFDVAFLQSASLATHPPYPDMPTITQSIAFDMGARYNGSNPKWILDEQGTTQYSGDTATAFKGQDGFGAGSLDRVSIGEDGVVTGIYSNGRHQELYTVGLTRFLNPWGLSKEGDNHFTETRYSGSGVLNPPGFGGTGTIIGNFLEQSNVDLATEIVEMISTQRNFQSNSKTVTTVDAMLSEVIEMKR